MDEQQNLQVNSRNDDPKSLATFLQTFEFELDGAGTLSTLHWKMNLSCIIIADSIHVRVIMLREEAAAPSRPVCLGSEMDSCHHHQ